MRPIRGPDYPSWERPPDRGRGLATLVDFVLLSLVLLAFAGVAYLMGRFIL